MSLDAAFQGSLFANDFLCDSVTETADWRTIDDAALDDLEAGLRAIFDGFPFAGAPNESQTEDDLIWPVLSALDWSASLRQQNLSAVGREDVPDGLLFADDAAKGRANRLPQEWRRYEHGLAVVESKRWKRPLDRRSGRGDEETAPSTQMLRYLRRVDDLTTGSAALGHSHQRRTLAALLPGSAFGVRAVLRGRSPGDPRPPRPQRRPLRPR